jgi:arylsulfatase A-like enzyme
MKRVTLLLSCVLLLAANISTARSDTSRPNVLFIICDDLNDYEGVFGGHPQAKTPNIDRLAKEGVQFMNAQTNCPMCGPSRNSLITGVYPSVSEDFSWTPSFKQKVLKHNKTIMEYLRENGYYTLGSGKLLHSNKHEYWNEWGVEESSNYGPFAFDGENQVGHPSVPEPYRSIGPVDGAFAPISDFPDFPERADGKATGWIYSKRSGKMYNYVDKDNRDPLPDEMHADWAVKRLNEMNKESSDKPFFMGVGFVRPHTPLYAPQRFFDMFPVETLKLSKIKKGDEDDTYYKDLYPAEMKGWRFYDALEKSYGGDAELGLKHFLQAYLACVAFADEQVGKVLDALDNSKFKDNTIVIFTADHGWQMGEKDYLYKNSPWDEALRIPLVIKAPNAKAGSKVVHPVSLIDIFPTITDMCELKGDNRRNNQGGAIGGYSLTPFLKNAKTKSWKGPEGAITVLTVDGAQKHEVARARVGAQTYSYRTEDWRYILYYDGREELYNKKDDPYSWDNLANNKKYKKVKMKLHQSVVEMAGEGHTYTK